MQRRIRCAMHLSAILFLKCIIICLYNINFKMILLLQLSTIHELANQDLNTSSNIIILHINEINNIEADEGTALAKKYFDDKCKPDYYITLEKMTVEPENPNIRKQLCNKYEEMLANGYPPHILLDTTKTFSLSETVTSFAEDLELPTVSATSDDNKRENVADYRQTFLIRVKTPAVDIPNMVKTLTIAQNLSHAGIFYDDTFDLSRRYLSLLLNVPVKHTIVRINSTELEEQVVRVRKMQMRHFFVFGRIDSINKILKMAERLGYCGKQYSWYVVVQEIGEIKCLCRNASVLIAEPFWNNKFYHQMKYLRESYEIEGTPGIVFAFYFNLAMHSFLTIRAMVRFHEWPSNMTYVSCNNVQVRNEFLREDFSLDLFFSQKSNEFSLYDSLITSKDEENQMIFQMQITAMCDKNRTIIGTWTNGFKNEYTFTHSNTLKKYISRHLYKIVIVLHEPFIFKDPTAPRGYSGFCIDMIEEISKQLNFDYELFLSEKNSFGYMDNEGEWNGAIKDIMDRKYHIALGTSAVMEERLEVIDFTIPFYREVGLNIIMKSEIPQQNLFEFVYPFKPELWYTIISLYLFTSFFIWIVNKWSPYSSFHRVRNGGSTRKFDLNESLWFCITSFTTQGGGEAPRNLSGRLIAATWWLFCYIVISSYTANLAAWLTVSRIDNEIKSIDDLPDQTDIQVTLVRDTQQMIYVERMAAIEDIFFQNLKNMTLTEFNGNLITSYFPTFEYPLSRRYSKLWKGIRENGMEDNLTSALARLRKNKNIALIEKGTNVEFLTSTNCEFQSIGEEISLKPYALIVQKGSRLKQLLSVAILRLTNNRYLEKLNQKWFRDNPKVKNCDNRNNDIMNLKTLGGIFIMLYGGFFLAFLTVLCEYLWQRFLTRFQ